MTPINSIKEYVDIVKQGLSSKNKDSKPKKIVIVGAGLTGLAAGYELLQAGHDVQILEAQHRVGGRIYTLREPFAQGLYAEAGAMRIPRAHVLTMAYIKKFGLQTMDFMMGNPQTYVHVGGIKHRMAEVQANPELMGFETSAKEKGRLAGDIWDEDDSSTREKSGERWLG